MTSWGELYQTFNRKLGGTLSGAVSTMECAYLFMVLALLGFPGTTATPQQYVQWTSQTFIQLVMLAVISYQQSSHTAEIQHLRKSHEDLHQKFDTHIAHKPTRKRATP